MDFFVLLICSLFAAYGQFLKSNGEQPVTWKRAATMEDVLREADVVSTFALSSHAYCLWP